jgi:hypothetical protein
VQQHLPHSLTGGRDEARSTPGQPCLEKEIFDFRAFEENPAVTALLDSIEPQKTAPKTPCQFCDNLSMSQTTDELISSTVA